MTAPQSINKSVPASGTTTANGTKSAKPTTKTTTNNNNNSVLPLIGTLVQFIAAVVYASWALFGRTSPTSITSHLYDLLFTDALKDYAPSQHGISYVGPALLATATRPLSLVFDERVRSFIFAKLVPHLKLSNTVVDSLKLIFQDTRMWNFYAARLILSAVFVWSLAVLRRSLAAKFKSPALPRIFTALSLASVIPLLAASSLQTQTFSMILFNLALASLFSGHFNRTVSLLTVNLVIFDIFGGSVLLFSALLVSFIFLDSFRPVKAFASFLLTLPVALAVSLVFDSLFYNKFIWPQGELFLNMISSVSVPTSAEAVVASLKTSLSQFISEFSVESVLKSKLTVNLGIALLPAVVVYIFGRSNRYTRALLSLYVLTSSFNLAFMSGTINSACTPQIVPLLVAASISVLGGIRSSSRVAKSATYFFFLAVILPATFWTVGRLHLEISAGQQFAGSALMALNAKISKEAQEGVPVRVFVDPEVASYGYNRFFELSRNTMYSTTTKAARTDYYVGPQSQCPESKAMKSFDGFQKVDLKSLSISQTPRVGVFRASPSCPISTEKAVEPVDKVSETSEIISKHLLKGQFASLREQRDFIAQHLGKFNHKKISNSIGLVAYLYANILEQI